MLRQHIMWALICATAPFVCAREAVRPDSMSCDTIEYSISPQLLNEIVVTAAPVITKADRKIIRPDKRTLGIAADGVDLLRKLQLPGVTVNPMTGEIVLTGGGSVMLCINGVEATSAQISAIRPEDILRIEYHDSPGVRYTGAGAVIDYITSRHTSGATLAVDAFGAFAAGRYASIDHLSGQYNRGSSVWNVNVGYMGQRKDKWIRDYNETWHYPDATLTRRENGLPVKVGGTGMESLINYNYLRPGGDVFNLRVGFDFNDIPNQETGDRRTLLITSATDVPVTVVEHTEERSVRPNVGIYYIRQLSSRQNLTFDMQGSLMHSRMSHEYSENGVGECASVRGDKYSFKFQGMYEHRAGSRVWNVGVFTRNSRVRNSYRQDEADVVKVGSSQTALAGEYSNRFGNWSGVFNLRGAYNHVWQENSSISKFCLLPAVNISFRPSGKCFVRYTAALEYVMPSASEISDVTQPVQTGMVRRGNPALKPFRRIDQTLTTAFESSLVGVEGKVEYRNEHSPIMESVLLEDGVFVRTYFNQRSFQRLRIGASVSLRPWGNHLAIMVEPVLNRYFSHGIDYRHTHSIFRVGLSLDFSYGRWLAYGNIMSGPENRMYGEEIIEEKDMNQIMVGYKRNAWSVHVGVFNAFMRDYWMETRNLSALTPYTSRAHSGRSSSYIAMKLSLALDFGRKSRMVDVPDDDTGSDSGIVTGTK